jgi:hypothetical protein
VGRTAWAVLLAGLIASTAACGGNGDSINDVSAPTIDGRFAVGPDGQEVALVCFGAGSPAVFLEPGDGGSGIEEFAQVVRALGRHATACTYDRLGAGNSDPPAQGRRTLVDVAAVLHDLRIANLPVPFVHVGASAGGPVALFHAAAYPDDVAGVVLLDVTQDDPDEGAKFFPGAKAWKNPEHVDVVDGARRMLRLRTLALDDTPLQVMTAEDGQSDAENQSAWLRLSSDSQQTTVPGGHDLAEENPAAVVSEIQKLLDEIDD